MGVLEEIQKNLRDIGGGIGSVLRGDPTSDREREQARREAQFEQLRLSPIPDTSGFTPVRDPSGRISDARRTGGGLGSRGVGGARSSVTSSAELARIKAEEEATRKEGLRVARVGKQVENITQRLKLGRVSDRQRQILQTRVQSLNQSIGLSTSGITKIDITPTTKVIISKDVKKGLEVERFTKRQPKKETIKVQTKKEFLDVARTLGRPPTLGEGLEKVEVAIFPALINKKFLDSQLGAKLTSGNIREEDRVTANRVNELLPLTAGFGPQSAKASLEILQLTRQADADIQRDLRKADRVGKTFERFGAKFDTINQDLKSGDISESTAIRLQNELLNKFNAQGFIVDKKNGSVDISHPVYDRLGGFTGSAWSNILKQAKKGDSPIKDQALIGTLDFLNNAYETEKIVLAFALAGTAGLKLPTTVGTTKQLKVLNTVSKLSGGALVGSFGAFRGIQTLEATGEPLLALTSGAGTIAGFLAPSALVRINQSFKNLEGQSAKRVALSKRGRSGGRGRTQQVQVKKPKPKAKKKVKLEISSKQATEGFAKLPRSRQIAILENKFRGRQLSQLEINQARNFMKRAGLQSFQIDDRLAESFRRIQLSNLRQLQRGDKLLGIDPNPQLKEQIRILIQGKSQILKVLKLKTIASQTVVLKPLELQQQINLNERVVRIKIQLERGFLTPLQESILKAQLVSLQQSLKTLTTGTVQVVTISPQQTSFQRLMLQSRTLEQGLRVKLKSATNKFSQASIQQQIQLQKQRQTQLQNQLTRQNQLQRQRQDLRTLQNTRQQLNQLTSQKARQDQLILSLTRQRQFSKSATRQDSLTKQLLALKTLQRQTTRQIAKTKQVQRLVQKKVGEGGDIIKPTPIPPGFLGFGIKKKKIKKIRGVILKPKKFQVFVRKRGKDILFKSFKTKRKARTELKKRLSVTLRASGFIFDKKRGVKIKPKVTKGFRLGKIDKLRLVEKRGRRLDTKIETTSIQKAKRLKKSFNGKTNFKKVKSIKLKRRKK